MTAGNLSITYRGFTVEIVTVPDGYGAGWCDCGGAKGAFGPPACRTPGAALDRAMRAIDRRCGVEAEAVMNQLAGEPR